MSVGIEYEIKELRKAITEKLNIISHDIADRNEIEEEKQKLLYNLNNILIEIKEQLDMIRQKP